MSNQPFNPQRGVSVPVVWKGASDRQYQMTLHPLGTAFRPVPGVYIFCRPGTAAGYWTPVYIGQAESLQDRLTDRLTSHHQWESIQRCGATHICAAVISGDAAERLRIETDLRHAYKTPCNLQ